MASDGFIHAGFNFTKTLWRRKGVDGEVSENLLEVGRFRVLLYPEAPELAPPGPPESFGIEK
jgi:hypothetical protein